MENLYQIDCHKINWNIRIKIKSVADGKEAKIFVGCIVSKFKRLGFYAVIWNIFAADMYCIKYTYVQTHLVQNSTAKI